MGAVLDGRGTVEEGALAVVVDSDFDFDESAVALPSLPPFRATADPNGKTPSR